MPNRLLSALLLSALLLAAASLMALVSPTLAATTDKTEVVAVCASPEGLARYFRGDIVSADAVRPASAADAAQHLSLVRQGGDYDLLLTVDGVVRSIRATGADIKAVVAEGGAIHHLMVEQDGYLDHFVFQSGAGAAHGKVVWATQRIMRDQGSTLASAPCDGN